jgi:hypothetical protein
LPYISELEETHYEERTCQVKYSRPGALARNAPQRVFEIEDLQTDKQLIGLG